MPEVRAFVPAPATRQTEQIEARLAGGGASLGRTGLGGKFPVFGNGIIAKVKDITRKALCLPILSSLLDVLTVAMIL